MKLRFALSYITQWGENLYVSIDYISSAGKVWHHDVPMNTMDGQFWTVDTAAFVSQFESAAFLRYEYQVRNTEGTILRCEWCLVPRIIPFDSTHDYIMEDAWRDIPVQQYLYTNAYLTTINGRPNETFLPSLAPLYNRTLIFYASAPQLLPGQTIAICGSCSALGNWSTSRYLRMQYVGQSMWMLSVDATGFDAFFEYKYVVISEDGQFHDWEEGCNRTYECKFLTDRLVYVIDGGIIRVRSAQWKVAGITISLPSLRSKKSCGIGDFGDLRMAIDWAVKTGMKTIRIQPINDTGFFANDMGLNPFEIISAYAINPIYINLEDAGKIDDIEYTARHKRKCAQINALPIIDLNAVRAIKNEYLSKLYDETGSIVIHTDEYNQFVRNNATWLTSYAAFCILCQLNSTDDYSEWKDFSYYNEKKAEGLIYDNKERVLYIYFVQYLLHRQVKKLADYARSHGVFLINDVAMGISPNSVDAWKQPDLFHRAFRMGNVPNSSNQNGTVKNAIAYNWDAMARDGYGWLRLKLSHISRYFDSICIDEIGNYFHTWYVPDTAVSSVLGHFWPSLPYSSDEIERFGLKFRKHFFTKPLINDKVISKLFGIHADYVKTHFVDARAYGLYDIKPAFCTQQKIKEHFEGKNDENTLWLRDGLYRLIENVLFVEDPAQPAMYHPRILAYREPIYEALDNDEKEAFMHLYADYYCHRHNLLWERNGRDKLSAVLKGTRMLVAGEDTRIIAERAESVIKELNILPVNIQTYPRNRGTEFAHLNEYPYLSVASTSTYGTLPMHLWWKENRGRTQRFFSTMLQKGGQAPALMPAYISEEITARHLYCPSMVCLLAINDLTETNLPTLQNKPRTWHCHHTDSDIVWWSRRLPIYLENLLEANTANEKLKTLIKRSRR